MPDEVLHWGIRLIFWLQSLGDWPAGPMNFFTFTGYAEFYLLVMPAVYWCWDSRLGLRLAVIFLLSTALNFYVKLLIHDPRPYWLEPRVRLLSRPEISFGAPSGHAQNAVVVWGTLAAYLKSGWAWLVAGLLIFLVGLSRVYLGVHFPTDVLIGWLIGAVLLILLLKYEPALTGYCQRFSRPAQVGLLFALSLLLILLGWLLVTWAGTVQPLPPLWVENALIQAPDFPLAPFALNELFLVAAAFFGITTGAIWFNAGHQFDAGGPWLTRLGRYALGVIGVVILWQGLGLLFGLVAVEESLPGYALRYIRYALIGGWVSALAPLLFLRLGLAKGLD